MSPDRVAEWRSEGQWQWRSGWVNYVGGGHAVVVVVDGVGEFV
jgi:hypothetical protein